MTLEYVVVAVVMAWIDREASVLLERRRRSTTAVA
jgi:hypothetical protein